MKHWFTRNAVHIAVIGIFIAICFVYFAPAWQGKVLVQGDVLRAQAGQREIMEFKAKDGTAPLWTNAMFSGMPSYQVWATYPKNIGTHIMWFFKTLFPNPIDVLMLYLIGAYLLFNILKVRPWLAALGAIAVAFSSYNFIYIEAGHANKAYALAFYAPILAGILLTFRGKYLWGSAILALSLAMEIRVSHIQVTYYLFIAILILVGIELYHAYKDKRLEKFLKAMGYMLGALVIAVGINAGLLWTTYEYSEESIRGKANISSSSQEAESKGVSREYAYQWSQGVSESLTFLVPNAFGGGSTTQLGEDSKVAKLLIERGVQNSQAIGFASQMPTYWGDKPFTHGPWYFGAGVVFLFVLGIFIVKTRFKWWLIGATLLSLFLSFGKNFPLISDLFFNYFPLYNKFRAVESTLVIAAFLIPILAVLAIQELIVNKDQKYLEKKLIYSLGIVGGISLLIALVPSLFLSFKGANYQGFIQQLSQQIQDANLADAIGKALIKDRAGLAMTDAWRSLLFVLITAGISWLLIKNKLKATSAIIVLGVVILIDMWAVDRRYLNNRNFIEESVIAQQHKPREVDKLIMRDKSFDYRVLDLSTNPFTNANTSLYHNSIGGYHAAKLMRYQELIDRQFTNAINEDVLDMLNTRYLITSDGESERMQNRSTAAGNAWIVDRVTFVKNAEEEMNAIDSFNPKEVAIVGEEFKSLIDVDRLGTSQGASIELIDYHPDHLVYEYSAPKDVLAVFSEVWYDKGWNAYIDGVKIPYFRADYVLRAAQLPVGNHKVEFKFEPKSYYMGENISLLSSILLLLAFGFAFWKGRTAEVRTGK
jgi:hypothetical protein